MANDIAPFYAPIAPHCELSKTWRRLALTAGRSYGEGNGWLSALAFSFETGHFCLVKMTRLAGALSDPPGRKTGVARYITVTY